MHEIDMTADELVSALLNLASSEPVCILDSCGVGHLGSHLLIAGIRPVETFEISPADPNETFALLDEKLTGDIAAVFTLSYDFGRKMHVPSSSQNVAVETPDSDSGANPDLFLSLFDVLIIHDYDTGKTGLSGDASKFAPLLTALESSISDLKFEIPNSRAKVTSNFTKAEYIAAVEEIKERIRCGDTYQTNLTQQLSANLAEELSPEIIFARLRKDHPAPFAAFIKRRDSTVVSASPERFFKIAGRTITTSPIKGTRSRGKTGPEDERIKTDLLSSSKDIAENTMIVDLLRNDLGRVCAYGSIKVEKLCDLEEHPTLFHLVSTITGKLRPKTSIANILRAVFPCGSITGAPKINSMRIIDELEPSKRGLSMGAIGYYLPGKFNFQSPKSKASEGSATWDAGHGTWDLSVAIRTIVFRDQTAILNVGGGIVIDSDPEAEYAESLLKAKALIVAIGAAEDL